MNEQGISVPISSDSLPSTGAPLAAVDPAPPNSDDPLPFSRLPSETPRAFSAFLAFFQLGHGRSLPAVAEQLGEGLPTIKNWSSKHQWSPRLQAFNSGLLQKHAQDQAAAQRQLVANWTQRLDRFREQEWDAAQKLLAAAQCFLESFGDEELHHMTLGQVSRALKISSTIGRLALAGADLPESPDPAHSPLQQQLLDSLKRIYGQTSTSAAQPSP